MNTKKISLRIISTLFVAGALFFANPIQVQAAACNIYASMTTTVKNVTNWATTCTIAAVDGVDNGVTEASTTNTATLSLTTGGAITINNGGKLSVGSLTIGSGSISVQSGGVIKASSPIWIKDGDSDGWVHAFATTGEFLTATASGSRRLGLMKSYVTDDCNDAALSLTNTCYAYAQSAYYGYGQSSYYGYGQNIYYSYSQSNYYGYGQGYYCFLLGTKVQMADGTYKEIQDVTPGDEVLSYNTKTKQLTHEKVDKLIIHKDISGKYLTLNGNLKVTPNHPLFINGMWQTAGFAKVGDKIINAKGQESTISSIEISENGTNDLYNLHLDGREHNYFAEDVLVHNK